MIRILEDRRNPILGNIFRELRSPELQRDRHRFRANLKMLGTLVGWEIAPSLPTRTTEVKTPLGVRKLDLLERPPILGAVLRAALPFWEGMLEIFRESDSMIIGAARREGQKPTDTLEMPIDLSYRAIPKDLDREWILVDPMLATGSTIIGAYRQLEALGHRPKKLIVAAAIAYRGALERLEKAIPGIEIFTCAADDTLDERGYIVPGLGDAGDLAFGEKR